MPRRAFQLADKLLKIRKLRFKDILNYEKLIVAFSEMAKLMKEFDEVGGSDLQIQSCIYATYIYLLGTSQYSFNLLIKN